MYDIFNLGSEKITKKAINNLMMLELPKLKILNIIIMECNFGSILAKIITKLNIPTV